MESLEQRLRQVLAIDTDAYAPSSTLLVGSALVKMEQGQVELCILLYMELKPILEDLLILAIFSLHLVGVSFLLRAIAFIITIINMRSPLPVICDFADSLIYFTCVVQYVHAIVAFQKKILLYSLST